MLIPQNIVDEAKEQYGQQAVEIIVKDLKIQDFDERALKGICPFHDERTRPETAQAPQPAPRCRHS